jgi:hypothetical protein
MLDRSCIQIKAGFEKIDLNKATSLCAEQIQNNNTEDVRGRTVNTGKR